MHDSSGFSASFYSLSSLILWNFKQKFYTVTYIWWMILIHLNQKSTDLIWSHRERSLYIDKVNKVDKYHLELILATDVTCLSYFIPLIWIHVVWYTSNWVIKELMGNTCILWLNCVSKNQILKWKMWINFWIEIKFYIYHMVFDWYLLKLIFIVMHIWMRIFYKQIQGGFWVLENGWKRMAWDSTKIPWSPMALIIRIFWWVVPQIWTFEYHLLHAIVEKTMVCPFSR